MAPIIVLLFCYRLPTLDATQFRTYCEETHVPLAKSLLGSDHPRSHIRYYTNKDSGFVIGSPSSEDADLIAVITYDSEQVMEKSMRARGTNGIRELLEADEDRFMDKSRIKVVMVGQNGVGMSAREE